ncbi:uncharacterized protein BO97DRAFT_412273 [Aspergillus homomorphus CBS 101889]|uniref:Uncharacterized protein n=1 Tax=Aspergillus homomorphus (strain CBS 101889) TaxID=1450537 RepID=A0A395I4T8_ASPHC|nr:hypothetical protein BO97DRAFT_412273 [Aspergillus homomorphus CBS 101889]RAL14997.1 hypothetical protein BO97DRAFT_412273 [Aspergillus homomorphus CBS 101889]
MSPRPPIHCLALPKGWTFTVPHITKYPKYSAMGAYEKFSHNLCGLFAVGAELLGSRVEWTIPENMMLPGEDWEVESLWMLAHAGFPMVREVFAGVKDLDGCISAGDRVQLFREHVFLEGEWKGAPFPVRLILRYEFEGRKTFSVDKDSLLLHQWLRAVTPESPVWSAGSLEGVNIRFLLEWMPGYAGSAAICSRNGGRRLGDDGASDPDSEDGVESMVVNHNSVTNPHGVCHEFHYSFVEITAKHLARMLNAARRSGNPMLDEFA